MSYEPQRQSRAGQRRSFDVLMLVVFAAVALLAVAGMAFGGTSKLGVNLPPIASYHSGARYYIDSVKTSEQPGSFDAIDDRKPGPVDANGWPTGDHGRTLTPFGKGMKGTHTIIARGRLTDVRVRSSSDRATSFSYDAKADTTTAKLTITREDVGVSLQLRGTGLGPMQILRPGYASADAKHTREIVELVTHFGLARAMEAQLTNTAANDIVRWEDRPQQTDKTYTTRGMPWEDIVDLANAANVQPWLSVPYNANDDCVIRFARMVKERLRPGLLPIWELDNETWGEHFIQGQRNAVAAAEEQKADPLLRATPWGGGGDWNTWKANRIVKRVAHLRDLLDGVYGSRDAYRLVLNAQADSPQTLDVQLTYLKARGLRLRDVIHAIAIAPYADVAPALVDKPAATPDQYFAPGGIDVALPAGVHAKRYAQLARDEGVRLWVYEGGVNAQHRGPGTFPAAAAIQRDPRMATTVAAYLASWDWDGGAFPDDRLFAYFLLQGPWLEAGPAANFGATEDVGDLTGPKAQALLAAAAKYQRPPLAVAAATLPTTPTTRVASADPTTKPIPPPTVAPAADRPGIPRHTIINDSRNGWREADYGVSRGTIDIGNGWLSAKTNAAKLAGAKANAATYGRPGNFSVVDVVEAGISRSDALAYRWALKAYKDRGCLTGLYLYDLDPERDREGYAIVRPYMTHLTPSFYFSTGPGRMSLGEVFEVCRLVSACRKLDPEKPIAFFWRSKTGDGTADVDLMKLRELAALLGALRVDALIQWEVEPNDHTRAAHEIMGKFAR